MAVIPMKCIEMIGLMSDIDNVVKICGRSLSFQPDDLTNFYSDTKNFVPIIDKNYYGDLLESMDDIFKISNLEPNIIDDKDFVVSRKELTDYVEFFTKNLGDLVMQKVICNQDIEEHKRKIAETTHFLGLDLQLDKIEDCKYIKTTFGRIPIESMKKLETYKNNPYLTFFPCTSDSTHYWGMYISTIEQSENVDRIFSSLFFERYEISSFSDNPENQIKKLENELKNLEKQLISYENDIKNFIDKNFENSMRYYSKILSLYNCYNIKKYASAYKDKFVLIGWVESENAHKLESELNKLPSVEFSLSDGKNELNHSPPIKLKNNAFSKPFEFFVDMYGLPNYNEIDPTGFISVTFTVLFGIMFGDVGQGLVLSLIGLAMWKLKEMAIGRILIPCGISSAIFGLVYGSVFGFEHVLDPMYHALGFHEKPIEIMHSATTLLIATLSIGVLLLLIGMSINIFSSLRRKDYENGVFGASGISGLVFYVSLLGGLVLELLGIHVLSIPYVLILIILPLALILFKEPLGKKLEGKENWKPKKWGDYITQNSFELFETLLSYITNTMSFLRVGAFILIHAGMMIVVFTLADMLLLQAGMVGYVLVVILGNAFVIALEATLVCIQLLRLQYYELFSRFYVGAGRKFNPIRLNKQ